MAIRPELLDELLKECENPEELLGQNGLIKELTKGLVERMLHAEMTDHLGYEKHATEGHHSGNSRNGTSPKKLKTEHGEMPLEIPRDRNGSFNPKIVSKGQTRFDGFDDKKSEQYKNKLPALQKEFNIALEEAKDDKLIPKNTTIAKIGMLPSKPPKRWATTFNRIFGRKKAKAKAKAKTASKSIISKITDAVSTPKPKAKQATTNKKAPAKKKKGL